MLTCREILPLTFCLLMAAGATSAMATDRRGTPEEAQAMVRRAVELFKAKGEAAFAVISSGAEGFRDKDLYVFVYSTGPDAKVVAYGGPPVDASGKPVSDPPTTTAVVGRKASDIKDADGKPLGPVFLEKATDDGTWVDYRWANPATGTPDRKSSWVVRAGSYIFGCGVYKPAGG